VGPVLGVRVRISRTSSGYWTEGPALGHQGHLHCTQKQAKKEVAWFHRGMRSKGHSNCGAGGGYKNEARSSSDPSPSNSNRWQVLVLVGGRWGGGCCKLRTSQAGDWPSQQPGARSQAGAKRKRKRTKHQAPSTQATRRPATTRTTDDDDDVRRPSSALKRQTQNKPKTKTPKQPPAAPVCGVLLFYNPKFHLPFLPKHRDLSR
jgi:hypothetical protein